LRLVDAPGDIQFNAQLAVRQDGELYALLPSPTGAPWVYLFDGEGNFHRSIGGARPGEAPGEYQRITAVAFDAGDTLWVSDAGAGRVVLESVANGSRTMALHGGAVQQMRTLQDGRMLFTGAFTTRDGIGYLVHQIDRAGKVTHILESTEPFLAGRARTFERRMAIAGPQQYWLSRVTQYDIHLMGLNGDTVRTFRNAPSWWERPDQDSGPRIHDMGVDAEGLLWLTIAVPTPDPSAERELLASNPNVISLAALAKLTDHVVRVIDPVSGEVLAEERYDYFPLTFVSPHLAFTIRDAPDADPSDYRLDVWRFRISR
jgi:hypothetical protein